MLVGSYAGLRKNETGKPVIDLETCSIMVSSQSHSVFLLLLYFKKIGGAWVGGECSPPWRGRMEVTRSFHVLSAF